MIFVGYISQSVKLGTQVLPTYRVFSVEELKEATKNFEQSSYIGEGSIGKVLLNDLLYIYTLFYDSRICCHPPIYTHKGQIRKKHAYLLC